jgi:hypothetical protein
VDCSSSQVTGAGRLSGTPQGPDTPRAMMGPWRSATSSARSWSRVAPTR